MRKKFTLLFASLLAFVGVAKAGVTDLPEMSTEGAIKYYTIKNTRSNKYVNYAGDATKMTQTTNASLTSVFYFTASDAETVEGFTPTMIHNAATDKLLADFASWTVEGKAWFFVVDSVNATPAGLHIVNAANFGGWNALNDGSSTTITNYAAKDAGSIFVIEKIDFNDFVNNVLNDYKASAAAALDSCVAVNVLSDVTAEKAAVNAVTLAAANPASLNQAIAEVDAVIAEAFAGKYYTINTPVRADKGYMQMGKEDVKGTKEAVAPTAVWQFSYSNGGINVYNPYTGKYLCTPINENYTAVPVTTEQAEAGAYILNRSNTDNENDGAIVKFTSNGLSVHMEGTGYLVRWNDGGASEWNITEITDFSAIVNPYKEAALATLAAWDTLSVVFDAEEIADAKTAISAINAEWSAFETIDEELNNLIESGVYFTFCNADTASTSPQRHNAYLAANMNDNEGHGTKNFSFNAVWTLQGAGAGSFYLYNELNNVYLGTPSSAGDLVTTKEEAAAYTFEIKKAETNMVELKSGNETLHLCNHTDGLLANYDNDDIASSWYVGTTNITDEITALLATITAEDYAEVPALGQYTKKAYDALVDAEANATTITEIIEAIDNFAAAKNSPVFTINGVIGYAAGKSIYDAPGNVNGKGNTHFFKTTDTSDKTMWWALDMTTTEVGVIESVGIRNVGTGANFWGCSTIKITETEENEGAGIADDGIFLFYTTDNNNPIHAQNDGQLICRYGDKGAGSGSAWTFTYVGNTYDLNKESGESTGIESIETNNAELVIYDLTGRRVQKMEKGIYIVNGKKVLVK